MSNCIFICICRRRLFVISDYSFTVSDMFKGGKGPDPVLASLDKQMEEYKKSREQKDAPATEAVAAN